MVRKKLKTFKTYVKVTKSGKPFGDEYVYHSRLRAQTKEDAKKEITRVARKWNAYPTKKYLRMKVTKVKQIRK